MSLLASLFELSGAETLLFRRAKLNRWKFFTSSNSLITAFYILEKQVNSKEANSAIAIILKRIEIKDLAKELILASKSRTYDLEDASQIECSNNIRKVDLL